MSCHRLFEAEAMRDGRLGDVERASYERHAATCRACADEVAALAVLAERMRTEMVTGDVSSRPVDELHARRERMRLLAAFDGGRITPPASRARWWMAIAALAIAAALLLRPRSRPAPPAAHADVRAIDDAAWSARDDRIVLERGALVVSVTHPTPATRGIVVALPDGELEDTGTTFTVRVDDGRTTEVSVAEGSVVLKLRGRPDVVLAAGERWTRTVPPPVVASAAASAAPVVVASTTPLRRADPTSEYRAAVDAFDQGDNARAASAFAAFVEKHPADPHAEDAAYLRVLALQRGGDVASTRAAAATYLERFPNGFRRDEVERLQNVP